MNRERYLQNETTLRHQDKAGSLLPFSAGTTLIRNQRVFPIKAQLKMLRLIFFTICKKINLYFKKYFSEDIYTFMLSNKRFRNAGYERHWLLLDKKGERIGFLWFKHMLGGWRLQLDNDTGNEWEQRGPLETIKQLKTFLT